MVIQINQGYYDVYQYFKGGKKGVKKRLGEVIRKKLESSQENELDFVYQMHSLKKEIIQEIKEGNYDNLTSSYVRGLFPISEKPVNIILGEPHYTDSDIPKILEDILRSEFTSTRNNDAIKLIPEYLTLKAFIDL